MVLGISSFFAFGGLGLYARIIRLGMFSVSGEGRRTSKTLPPREDLKSATQFPTKVPCIINELGTLDEHCEGFKGTT